MKGIWGLVVFGWVAVPAGAATPAETAAAFGARPAVQQLSLSPDGAHIAFIAPSGPKGTALYTVALGEGADPRPALVTTGVPERLTNCNWVSNARLTCTIYGVVQRPEMIVPFSRLVAVDAAGGHQVVLSTRNDSNSLGVMLYGGGIIDWLPGKDGQVLIQRDHMAQDGTGSLVRGAATRTGLGVEQIDTRTLAAVPVEQPKPMAESYLTDGHGTVRIVGFAQQAGATGYLSASVNYAFHPQGSRELKPLSTFNGASHAGFLPQAVDPKRDVVIGLEKMDGRYALVEKALDGTGTETVRFRRPDVDVDGVLTIGRDQRVVGATYNTDVRHVSYFDPEVKATDEALHRALPKYPIVDILDSSVDGSVLLIRAAADNDPGRYYLFDRNAKKLSILMDVRPQLAGRTLATVKAVTFPAADGTPIPAFLTLPPGVPAVRLRAIVLPHGGPSARDEWGFDWLPQFFAARGYAVLQPQFRGSDGYGDAWLRDQGFRQWRVAVGDVNDAGRWLVKEGIADPAKLAIFGWSYGGYAALQSQVLDPDLYKAVVAVAPVTDLASLKEEGRNWGYYRTASDFIGNGPEATAGSPAQNAQRFKAPVLLVHGTLDRNVRYPESTLMQARLKAANKTVDLLGFPGLDHQLDDTEARAQMLERSDAFIRAATGG
jgi:dienelactone hydrolase